MMHLVRGVVVGVEGASEGPASARSYTVRWTMPTGTEQTITGCGTRQISASDPMERRAFAVGFMLFGVLIDDPVRQQVVILDREDYAVGCE